MGAVGASSPEQLIECQAVGFACYPRCSICEADIDGTQRSCPARAARRFSTARMACASGSPGAAARPASSSAHAPVVNRGSPTWLAKYRAGERREPALSLACGAGGPPGPLVPGDPARTPRVNGSAVRDPDLGRFFPTRGTASPARSGSGAWGPSPHSARPPGPRRIPRTGSRPCTARARLATRPRAGVSASVLPGEWERKPDATTTSQNSSGRLSACSINMTLILLGAGF